MSRWMNRDEGRRFTTSDLHALLITILIAMTILALMIKITFF